MDELKTLKEVCLELDVSRRAVQGYEKAGLVKATQRNRYGYLLYDEKAVKRIAGIKFFQEIGFTIKEITELIDVSTEMLKSALARKTEELETEIAKKELVIKRAKELINELED